MADIHTQCLTVLENTERYQPEIVQIIQAILISTKTNTRFHSHANRKKWWSTNNQENLYLWLLEKTAFLDSNSTISQRLWCVLNNVLSYPTCDGCGIRVYFSGLSTPPAYCKQCVREYAIKKARNTVLQKYGAANYSTTPECREKVKNTVMKKYGVENVSQCQDVKDQIKSTVVEKYGVENVSQCPDVKSKIKKTFLKNYGVSHPMKDDAVKNKLRNTCLEKYGVDNPSKSSIVKTKINTAHFSSELLGIIESDNADEQLLQIWNMYGYQWFKSQNVSDSWILQKFTNLGIDFSRTTLPEKMIEDLLIQHNILYTKHNRTIIPPQELDFFLPDYNLAIEVNGIAHHCELGIYDKTQNKTKNYHLKKTQLCAEKNIKLIHITDAAIIYKWPIVKSRLCGLLGQNQTVGGRKGKIQEISNDQKKQFFNKTHIQGDAASHHAYGLFIDGCLYAAMSFSKSRYNKNYGYELVRFSSELNTSVLGGASRLLFFFLRKHNNTSIISYADRAWSPIAETAMYTKIGFTYSHTSKPSYWYTNDYITLHHRSKFQKHKLYKLLDKYDCRLTEWQNMAQNGWNRYWDCGSHVFVYN